MAARPWLSGHQHRWRGSHLHMARYSISPPGSDSGGRDVVGSSLQMSDPGRGISGSPARSWVESEESGDRIGLRLVGLT